MSHYDTFDNEDERLSQINGFYETSGIFRLYNVNRTKLGNNVMKVQFFDCRGIHFYAKIYFRKKNQKILIYTIKNEFVGTIEKKNNTFTLYPNNEVKPILIIKHIYNNNGPSSAAVLLTDQYTTDTNINLFIKSKITKNLENQFPVGKYITNQVPIVSNWYDKTYTMRFIQSNITSSRKNIRLNIPFQDKTTLEFGKIGRNQFNVISRDDFYPVRTAAFCFSWLSIL